MGESPAWDYRHGCPRRVDLLAEKRDKVVKAFAADYSAKWPKAGAKIIDDLDVLLAFYDYPARSACRSAGTSGSGSAA